MCMSLGAREVVGLWRVEIGDKGLSVRGEMGDRRYQMGEGKIKNRKKEKRDGNKEKKTYKERKVQVCHLYTFK